MYVKTEVHLLKVLMSGYGRSQHARSLEHEPDHADVEDSVERVEFCSGRDMRLQNSGVHLVVEHRQRAPLGGKKFSRLLHPAHMLH